MKNNVKIARIKASLKQEQLCIHAVDLSGGAGPDLNNVGDHLSEDDIKEIIYAGTGSMPPVNLDQNEADALAKWLVEL